MLSLHSSVKRKSDDMLNEWDQAPEFELQGVDGQTHKLSDYVGQRVVLYFYPKDDTSGCTIEAKEFTNNKAEIEKLGATVIGISKDSYESHCEFRDKYGLSVLLLSDPSTETINAYDSWGDKGIFGMGTIRNTFIIDKSGKILKIYKRVQPLGHSKAVLEYLKSVDK